MAHKLRDKRNTRYGWLVKLHPTGTFTLQGASSFLDGLTLTLAANGCRGKVFAFHFFVKYKCVAFFIA